MAKKAKHAGGRPTKYKPEITVQAHILAEHGFTDKEIAEVFAVTEQTLNNWKRKYPQFFESLKAGKEIADQKVVQSLYERALGYSHPEVHITSFQGSVTKTDIIKHYPPDPTSAIFWLKNRQPDKWREKHEVIQQRTEGEQLEIDEMKSRLGRLEDAGDGIPTD
jgi:hypothetical protein